MKKLIILSFVFIGTISPLFTQKNVALGAGFSSSQPKISNAIEILDQEIYSVDTIFEESELDITIRHHLQEHFEFRNNTLSLTIKNNELAATFNDPSRALYRHTGISTSNDQANGIIYRGLPSHLTKWTINSVEIVNPNHLSNAGSLSDQSSISAGGVLAVPFDVVRRFNFNASPLSPNKINAISGILDFDLNGQSHSFLKIGLLGFEAAYQGKQKSKIKAHARYSTVGLLSDFGVDFDGEQIDFQDIFFQIQLTEELQFFSIVGSSNNVHITSDSSLIDEIKDIQNIEFNSVLSVQGLHYKKGRSRHDLIFSHNNTDWSTEVSDAYSLYNYLNAKTNQLNTLVVYNGEQRVGENSDLGTVNLTLNAGYYKNSSSVYQRKYDDSYFTFKPSVIWSKSTSTLFFQGGVSSFFDSHSRKFSIEPGISFSWVKDKFNLELNSSFSTHQQPALILGDQLIINSDDNPYLERSKSFSSSIALKMKNEDEKKYFLGRLFLIELYNLPLNGAYSPLVNSIDYTSSLQLMNIGRARSYGVELMYDINISPRTYANINLSFFDAEFRTEQGEWENAQFNFGHIFNTSLSHFVYNKKKSKWMFNLAGHLRGGAWENGTIMQASPSRLGTYWRIDMLLSFRWKNRNILNLDIQNILNRENEAYRYYDPLTDKIRLEKQLGMIPILSYKRVF